MKFTYVTHLGIAEIVQNKNYTNNICIGYSRALMKITCNFELLASRVVSKSTHASQRSVNNIETRGLLLIN